MLLLGFAENESQLIKFKTVKLSWSNSSLSCLVCRKEAEEGGETGLGVRMYVQSPCTQDGGTCRSLEVSLRKTRRKMSIL